jgi:hypothetical protein
MKDKSYIIRLDGNTTVALPDKDGHIYLEFEEDMIGFYLSKEDVLKLLERFD